MVFGLGFCLLPFNGRLGLLFKSLGTKKKNRSLDFKLDPFNKRRVGTEPFDSCETAWSKRFNG